MEREEDNYSTSVAGLNGNNYAGIDYSLYQNHLHRHKQQQENHHQTLMKQSSVRVDGENTGEGKVVDYMFNNSNTNITQPLVPPPPQQISSGYSLDRLSFAEVMQFADFGPKLALNQKQMMEPAAANANDGISEVEDRAGKDMGLIDPVYFLKFPVLSERSFDQQTHDGGDDVQNNLLLATPPLPVRDDHVAHDLEEEDEEARIIFSENSSLNDRLGFLEENNTHNHENIMMNSSGTEMGGVTTKLNRRKRPRSVKTSEEVESQRMTHIAVERNRRKQMNGHLRVLRSLMPGSYVQRGDQASIIGGAIEFVRELEQLLQCLESQKRRRLYGDNATTLAPSTTTAQQLPPPMFPQLPLSSNDQINKLATATIDVEQMGGGQLHEDTAENKSCLADVEVKLLGMDAMVKILSRRRPGQLLKTIAALEDLELDILHTNVTTIEQTVLYSFNVKVVSETRFTAEDIAGSIQQIFNFIHAST
ncbi:hypothetical protein C5167_031972 [Papaver somniferum]|uniref:BHLH domain-containing protein n=1 Tax=Papaver somniferum TaxID=3469 RepID=A0A4Y7K903_PAPSO|nr:transcription factor FAMA-like [Papaver somniferum]RZC68802.1 hypothetical protein C5167_031972 [Papaver somniferum]